MSTQNEILVKALTENGTGKPPSTDELLSQLLHDDPRLNLLASYLGRNGQQSEDQLEIDGTDELEGGTWQEENVRLADEIGMLRNELLILREMNRRSATALGACELCWGRNAECVNCLGDGGAGAFLPDRRQFAELVVPALQRLPRRRARPAARPQAQHISSERQPSERRAQ
jgi:hypothetical protein